MDSTKATFDCFIDSIITNAQQQLNYARELNDSLMATDSSLEMLENLKELMKAQGVLELLNQQFNLVLSNLEQLPDFSPDTLYSSHNFTFERLKKFNDKILLCTTFLEGKIRYMQTYFDELITKNNATQQDSDDDKPSTSGQSFNAKLNETNSSNGVDFDGNPRQINESSDFDAQTESSMTGSKQAENGEHVSDLNSTSKTTVQKGERMEDVIRDIMESVKNNKPGPSNLSGETLYQSLIYNQFEKLFNIPAVGNNSKFLQTLTQKLADIIHTLRSLNADTNHLLVEVVIRSKLPWKAVEWIYMEDEGRNAKDWSIEKMLNLMHIYSEIEEQEFKSKNANRSPQARKECVFCGDKFHTGYKCLIYPTIAQRLARLQDMNKCNRCLKPAHGRCQWKCQLCLEPHHKVVCPLQESQQQNQSNSAQEN